MAAEPTHGSQTPCRSGRGGWRRSDPSGSLNPVRQLTSGPKLFSTIFSVRPVFSVDEGCPRLVQTDVQRHGDGFPKRTNSLIRSRKKPKKPKKKEPLLLVGSRNVGGEEGGV